jgi:hypothetical protein
MPLGVPMFGRLQFCTLAVSFFACFSISLAIEPAKDIADAIDASRKKLLNLNVQDFTLVTERYDEKKSQWSKTPIEASGEAWYNGAADSKARINFTSITSMSEDPDEQNRSKNNPDVWVTEVMDIGYNGRGGRRVRHKGMDETGKAASMRQAAVLQGMPEDLTFRYNRIATGAEFTAYYSHWGKELFADLIIAHLRSPKATVTSGAFRGVECIKIGTTTTEGAGTVCWVDPKRGYAMVGFETSLSVGKGKVRIEESWHVDKLIEAGPGIWYPLEATFEEWRNGEKYRWIYKAKAAKANIPDFSDDVFDPPIPAGYLVFDQATGAQYRLGESPEILRTKIDTLLNDAVKPRDIGLASNPVDISNQNKTAAAGNSGSIRTIVAVVLIGAAVVMGLFIATTRIRRGRIAK